VRAAAVLDIMQRAYDAGLVASAAAPG